MWEWFPFFMGAILAGGAMFVSVNVYWEGQLDSKIKESEAARQAAETRANDQEAETARLELERQSRLADFPLEMHFDTFLEKLSKLEADQLKGTTHNRFVQLYTAMTEVFKENGLVPLEQLVHISKDAERINQIESVLDLYTEKQATVKADTTLDEDTRATKLAYWQRMQDRDIARLEEG